MIKKTKLLLVADLPSTPFANIAENFAKHIPCHIRYLSHDYFRDFSAYDKVHFLCWPTPSELKDEQLRELASKKVGHGIYAYTGFMGDADVPFRKDLLNFVCDGYSCSTKGLMELTQQAYKDSWYALPPTEYVPDGVDLSRFQYKKKEFSKNKLVIGWTGDSLWRGRRYSYDHKGLNTVVRPAWRELKAEGYDVELSLADKRIRLRNDQEMLEWYKTIDVLIIASKYEGTPNPMLEAAAQGIPIITTDCGICRDVLGKKQNEFIIARDKDALKEAILKLYQKPKLQQSLSEENLHRISRWDWSQYPLTQMNNYLNKLDKLENKFKPSAAELLIQLRKDSKDRIDFDSILNNRYEHI